jgi:hypothetical protein
MEPASLKFKTSQGVREFLESVGKIDFTISPSENAVSLLDSILCSHKLQDVARASILYALDVLKQNQIQAEAHVSLQTEVEAEQPDEEFSTVVKDWILSNYTPNTPSRSNNKRKLSFKLIAHGVKFAVRMRGNKRSVANGIYAYDLQPNELERISEVLQGVDRWEWDAWKLHNVTEGRPLQTLGWHLLHDWGLVRDLKLDTEVLRSWLTFVELQYADLPYHNSTHATDVLHAAHHFLSACGAAEFLPALSVFAVLIGAMIHDAGHDGLNNLYHQNALTERALTFNDQSVQENYHCMTILTSMAKDSRIDILHALGPAQAKEVRRLLILLTLGTDMKHHFKHVQDLAAGRAANAADCTTWASDAAARDQLCATLVHAADISNTARHFPLARGWADRVMIEFLAQGDRERAQGLPVSPLCARDGTLTSTSQMGFVRVIVLPYFKVEDPLATADPSPLTFSLYSVAPARLLPSVR